MGEHELYIDRELSWLEFDRRVLEEAEREDVPLCERLKFLSIYQSNLDEFFMVRVGGLLDRMPLCRDLRDDKTGMTAQEQLRAVLARIRELDRRAGAVYAALLEQLAGQGVRLAEFQELEGAGPAQYFDREIAPRLAPVTVGEGQPFPFLEGQEICAAVVLAGRGGRDELGIIQWRSDRFPELIPMPRQSGAYMLPSELILRFAERAFEGRQVKGRALICLTRNGDISPDTLWGEGPDRRAAAEAVLERRRRSAPVRLELALALGGSVERALLPHIPVGPELVFHRQIPLDLSFFHRFREVLRGRPQLFYERRVPQWDRQFQRGRPVLSQIREGDKLLSYPFHTMEPFLSMLWEAACDDKVVSIEMTLYRVARRSRVVEALIRAAENGKKVLVLVELRARFDEENNIRCARRLEAAGCQVIYGPDRCKVHAKLCLITRRTEDGVERYTQIGTGNYNEETAQLYTDLSLMTADREIGREAAAVFRALALGEEVRESGTLMVAPWSLRDRLLEQIDREAALAREGRAAYIGIKVNGLTDRAVIDRLAAASQAGVDVELVVRGICCLRPGVEGATDRVRAVSIVGRYLEHSRIYIFGTGGRRQVFLSSADLMTRNTLRRVEAAVPVRDPELRERIWGMFQVMLRDNRQARRMEADGSYTRAETGGTAVDSQEIFSRQAYQSSAAVLDRPEIQGNGGAGDRRLDRAGEQFLDPQSRRCYTDRDNRGREGAGHGEGRTAAYRPHPHGLP